MIDKKTILANLALLSVLIIVGSFVYSALNHILGWDAKFTCGLIVGVAYMDLKFKKP